MTRPARLTFLGLTLTLLVLPACGHTAASRRDAASLAREMQQPAAPATAPHAVDAPQGPPRPIIADPRRPPDRPEAVETSPPSVETPRLEPTPVTAVAPNPPLAPPSQGGEPGGVSDPPPPAIPEQPAREPLPYPPQALAPTERHPVVLALQEFLADRPDEAIKHLRTLHARDQELLLRLLPIIARVEKEGLLTPQLGNEEKLALLDIFRPLLIDLQTSAPLIIDKLAFCKEIRGYGIFQPLDKNYFRPGDLVMIYAEVHNLSDQQDGSLYVAHLTGTVEIRTADCKVVAQHPIPKTESRSQSYRHDHFVRIRFPIPGDLPAGFYMLQVRMKDNHTKREAAGTLNFRVTTTPATSRP